MVMSTFLRPKLAALLGAATLTAAGLPAAALERPTTKPLVCQHASSETDAAADAAEAAEAMPTLGSCIEARLQKAQQTHRYDEIDELTTLWLTLQRRGQLDRVVGRSEQFLNVALRNQKRSAMRSATRRHRRAPFEANDVDLVAPSFAPGQALDADRFIDGLTEPYRSAVMWTLTGRNHREVADEMGVSHAAVRKWAQRLREQLAS